MNYFIQRSGQEYGPYTLADLQKYVKSGSISPADMCRSEGMSGLLPVSQIVGNIPAPEPSQQASTVYGGAGAATGMNVGSLPQPPSLHWGLVLLFGVLTCGIFLIIWVFIQAAFVRKLDAQSKAIGWLIAYLGFSIGLRAVAGGMSAASHNDLTWLSVLAWVGGVACHLVAVFSMKASLEEYYNSREPIGLQLSGVMVFFFATLYFQYHFNEITERHKAMRVIA
jgi:hypothetical protein